MTSETTSPINNKRKTPKGRAKVAVDPDSRPLQLEFKSLTTQEIRDLIKYISQTMHGHPSDPKGHCPRLLGRLRKEYYYRMGHGGTTVSEKYPQTFTPLGPKTKRDIKRHDDKLMNQTFNPRSPGYTGGPNKNNILTEPRKPKLNKDGSYSDPVRTKLSNGLTMREEKYCIEFVSTADPLEAWIRAGYDISYPRWENHAAVWKDRPHISRRILELIDEAKEKMAWDAEKVLDRFDEIYKNSLAEQDFTNATRSMENIAKHLGMYVERTEQRIGSLDGMKTDDIDGDIDKLANVVGLKVVNGGKT